MHPDPKLIAKYNVQGPRYTSYPTVPYWDQTPTPEEWIASLQNELDRSEAQQSGAALYVHIPFCERLCTYCGCNTRITRNRGVGLPYVETVLKEWEQLKKHLNGRIIPVSELHLGGGTPTFLTPEELQVLVRGLQEGTSPTESPEYSIEVDPRVTTSEHLRVLQALGFRRISLGVQDFDPQVQEIVHRVQSAQEVKALTDEARSLGFESVNYDLIYGLPLQTEGSISQTMDEICDLRPDRIAFYSYAHVPWIKASQRRWSEKDLPSPEVKRKLYELGRTRLEDAGYLEIGLDHFSLETDSLWKAFQNSKLHRNFMGYIARHTSPLIGLGVSAISDSWNAFAQNEKVLEKYQRRVQAGEIPLLRGHVLNSEDATVRRHILNLMTRLETSIEDQEFEAQIRGRLQECENDQLITWKAKKLQITSKGHPFIRNVCMALDTRLAQRAPDQPLFSKTI